MSLSDWIATLSLVVTAALTIIVAQMSHRGQRQTEAILTTLGDLAAANRMDALAVQAGTLTRKEDLDAVLDEARVTGSGRSLTRIYENYWANPAVPLSEVGFDAPESVVRVVQRNLASKLSSDWGAMRELTWFVQTCGRSPAFEARQVSGWIRSELQMGRMITDGELRKLLEAAEPDLYRALLLELDSIHARLPSAVYVNIGAGVALAYLDRIGYFPRRDGPDTRERSAVNVPFAQAVISGLGYVLQRGNLTDLAKLDPQGCSISQDSAAALVVAVTGAASFANEHAAMRALESMAGLAIVPGTLGLDRAEYEFGLRKFNEYRPELLASRWPKGAAYLTDK